ncbi:MAG: NADH:flavin oxidoreductase [Steroidobacteraceae bacterium]
MSAQLGTMPDGDVTAPDEASLFRPFQLGSMTLRNRLVMAPMTRCFSPGGIPGPNVAAYYGRRAAGGVGLIVTEGTAVPHRAACNDPNVPHFHGTEALAGWSRVVQEVHAAGGRIVPQLWHVGLQRRPAVDNLHEPFDNRAVAVSPSGMISPTEQVADGMTERDIEQVVEAFATAAANSERLGFDGAEIHGAHGYLVDQFFWAPTNRRTDSYGGDAARRGRFAADLVQACRRVVRKDFPVILRISQFKQQDYSAKMASTPEELEQLLAPAVAAGVDAFHCSQRRFWEPEFPGSDLNLAGWVKKLFGRPTITVGSVGLDGEFVSSLLAGASCRMTRIDRLLVMLERGDFDLVALGRTLLMDPNWPAKIRRGAFDELSAYDTAVLKSLV